MCVCVFYFVFGQYMSMLVRLRPKLNRFSVGPAGRFDSTTIPVYGLSCFYNLCVADVWMAIQTYICIGFGGPPEPPSGPTSPDPRGAGNEVSKPSRTIPGSTRNRKTTKKIVCCFLKK